MADIELVIKMSEEDYLECVKRVKEIREKGYMIENLKYKIIIADGTPLPKEHGRLIDADEFHYILENMPMRDNDKWFNWLQKACNRLAEAPTIIEGDTNGK